MSDLLFPRYGRVAIIDDKSDEVKDIQNVLALNGVPYIYYDYDELSGSSCCKVDGIRLLFLDVNLEDGLNPSEEELKYPILASAVEWIIPPENGPYYIILWTKETTLRDGIEEYLKRNLDPAITTKPSMIGVMDKAVFLEKSFKEIEAEISKLISDQNMFAFLTGIENQTVKVPANVLKLISYNFIKEFNNEKIENVLVRFAMTERGCFDSPDNATRTVLRLFSDLIRDRYIEIISDDACVDSLTQYWSTNFKDTKRMNTFRDQLMKDVEQQAIINTVLNTNMHAKKEEEMPGRIYKHTTESLKSTSKIDRELLSDSTFDKALDFTAEGKEVQFDVLPIEIDITPSCDYAQGKNHLLRTVFGCLLQFNKIVVETDEHWGMMDYSDKTDGKSYDYVYTSPVFYYEDKLCVLAINTQLMELREKNFSDGLDYLFRLNDEITNEIRKKSGETISRLGINSINYKPAKP